MTFLTDDQRSIFEQLLGDSNYDIVIWNSGAFRFGFIFISRCINFLIFIWFIFRRNKVIFTLHRLILLRCYSLCFLFHNRLSFDRLVGDHRLHLNTLNCSNQIIAFVLLIRNTRIFMHSKDLRHVRIWEWINEFGYVLKAWIWVWNRVHWTVEETKLEWFFHLLPFHNRRTFLLRT